jgi:tRNA threonylcarbamoyladenosine biosynthesis protein TsaE
MEIKYELAEISAASQLFIEKSKGSRCFAFHGDMGAGKTTFISTVCKELGVTQGQSSPTFSIINEYHTQQNGKIFHIDLYRLKDEKEAIAAGVEDCFDKGAFCFVEWPEIAPSIFPTDVIHCFINTIDANTRILTFNL